MKTNNYIFRRMKLILIVIISSVTSVSLYSQSSLCESVGQDQNYEWVTRLKIGAGSGTSEKTGYYDFSGTSFATVAPSQILPVEIDVRTNGTPYQEYVKIWLDLNQDNSIDNATELVYNSNANVTTFMTFTGNITMPANSFNGTMFGRMIMQYAASPNLCGNYTYGTTYDFRLTVTGGIVNPTNKILTVAVTGSGSVLSDPAGINTLTGNFSANFLENSTVSLTATASGGNTFSGWSGAATGTSPSVNINMGTSDKSVTATFEAPATVSVLITNDVSSVSVSGASSGGNITNGGSSAVTSRGVCWSTSANPNITGNKTTDGSGTGSFTSTISGLSSGTVYYVRAYATNNAGTAYGNQVSFATPPTDPTSVTASSSSIYIGSSTELTAGSAQGTVYWYTGSCGGSEVGTGNPLTVSPATTTTYYARNNTNSVFSVGCASVTITVNKYDQTITFDQIPEKIYGVADFTPATSSSGLSVTYTSSNTSVSTIVDNKIHIVGVGSSDITASQAGNSTYNPAADIIRTLTVTKAALTVSADAKTKAYGETNPALTIQYSGWVNGDDAGDLTTLPTASTSVNLLTPVGTNLNAITVAGGADENYDFSYVAANFPVTKATLTVTADAKTKVYGAANPSLTFQYSGWLNSDDADDLTTLPSASTTVDLTTPVGTNSNAITVAGGADENYDFSYVAANFPVTKATLTVTADTQTKVYGAANPSLTFQYSGWLNGDDTDDLTTLPSASTAVDLTTPAGTNSNAITVAGGADENYDFSYVAANFPVTKATLTVTADAKTKVYGAANPSLTFQYSGWLNGDDAADLAILPVASTTVNLASPVSVYDDAITVAGGADENYDFSYVAANFPVTKATLTVTADAKTKVYGAANPSLTLQYSGWLNSDDAADLTTLPSASTAVNLLTPVGTNLNAITVDGGADENYDFSYVAADFPVTKATLTVTADALTKVYGAPNPSLTFQYSGWLNGDDTDDLTTLPSVSTAVDLTTPVGTNSNAITVSGGADENYDFSYVAANFPVTKATLTVTADAQTKVYGAANPSLTFQYSGWLNGDDAADLAILPVASTSVNLLTPVGANLNAITVAGGADENYDFSYGAADFSVTKATLTVTADAKTKVYGAANPSLTFQYSGWLNGDDAADLAILPVASTTVNLVSPVSVYDDAINVAGGTDGNYDFLYVAADFSVTKAILTVTADEKTKVYADTNPTLTFTYTGFVNGDDNSDIDINPTIITIADEYSETGLYPIVLGGGSDNNYSLSRTDGALTVVKATLQATADDKEKTYSEANPILTVTYSGFKNSDNSSSLDISPVASVAATTLSDAGTYPVTLSAGSDNNYDIVNTKGVLTIKKAALTIISDNKARLYGEANPALTVSYSGFVNSENEDVLDTKPLAVTVAVPTDATGVYAITASGAADNNYSFSYIDGSFVISKAMLTITAEGKSRKYGETNPAFTYIYSGFKNDDDARDIDLLPTQTTDAVSTTPVGSMQISLTGGTDNNYDFTLVNGILAITKNNLIISTDNKSKVYGQSNPPLTIRYSGFVNGEDHSVLLQAPQAEVNTDESSDAGTYAISVSGAASPNYEIEYLEGSIEVTKAPLHITADDAYKKFLEAIPELTISYSGFVNNENKNVLNVLPSVSTNAGSGSDAGVYDITASGASDNNYNFIYNKGILSILKADQVITFEDIPEGMRTTQEYRLEASSTSGLPVIFESSEPATVTLSGSDMEVIREGSVQISASQNGNHNWNAAPDVIRTVQTLPTFDNLRSLFTPNNDGMNDTWYIPDIEQYGKFSIQIFNRFGKLLYESSAYKNDWNGTYNGSPLPSASYYYLIKSSEKGIIKGVVNILR